MNTSIKEYVLTKFAKEIEERAREAFRVIKCDLRSMSIKDVQAFKHNKNDDLIIVVVIKADLDENDNFGVKVMETRKFIYIYYWLDLDEEEIIFKDWELNYKQPNGELLSDKLMPNLTGKNVEKYAEEMIKNTMPELLYDGCKYIGLNDFAERLGVVLRMEDMGPEFKGKVVLFFDDYEIKDEIGNVKMIIGEGNIVVDEAVFTMDFKASIRKLIKYRKTIIRLFIAYYYFKLAAKLMKLCENKYILEIDIEDSYCDDDDEMLVKSNMMVNKILMPATSFKEMVERLIYKTKLENQTSDMDLVLEDVIDIISEKIMVSPYDVKKRLVEVGYEEAEHFLIKFWRKNKK